MTRTHSPTHGRGLVLRIVASLLAAAALTALAVPASARALAIQDQSAQPSPGTGTTQAGQYTDFEIKIGFDSEHVENLRIGLPPGVVGNPGATVKCTREQLEAASCPATSQVGETSANATITVVALPVTLDISGKLYNLEPEPGEPARFGIVLTPVDLPDPLPDVLPPVILESAVELRKSDFGLDTIVEDIPNTTEGLPTHINSLSMTLYGEPPLGTGSFIRNPTSCGPAQTRFTADPHESDVETIAFASYAPTGCDQVPFTPGFTAQVGSPGQTAAGGHPSATTVISQTDEEAGLKRARVIMPTSLGADPDLLVDLCSRAAFAAHNCPPGTIVGSAVASSPLLTEALTGPVSVVEPSAPGLPSVGLDLTGPLAMQLLGDVVLDPAGGAGIEFAGLPDIPIADFALTFSADRLVVSSEDLCNGVPRTFKTEFEGHNGAIRSGPVNAAIKGCGPGGGKKAKSKRKCKAKKKSKGKARGKRKGKKRKPKCKRKKKKKR